MNKCQNLTFSIKDFLLYEKELKRQGINLKLESIDYNSKIKCVPNFESFDYAEKQQIRKTIALMYSERKDN